MLFEIQHSKWVYLNPVLHEDSSNFSHKLRKIKTYINMKFLFIHYSNHVKGKFSKAI